MSTDTVVHECVHFSIDGVADQGRVVFTKRDGQVQIEITGEREHYGLFFADFVQLSADIWHLVCEESVRRDSREYWFAARRFPIAAMPVHQIYIRVDKTGKAR